MTLSGMAMMLVGMNVGGHGFSARGNGTNVIT
jgi:hypothetical protein